MRLSGLHSIEALLRAGWSAASAERFERAVVPWSLLADRDPTEEAVQEALLALPYAYGDLEVHGRAAQLYERAAGTFGRALEKIDASIGSIENGSKSTWPFAMTITRISAPPLRPGLAPWCGFPVTKSCA